MDIRGDKHKFMDTHSQIFCPPACFDYQPHMGDEASGESLLNNRGLVSQRVLKAPISYRFLWNWEHR